MTARAPAVSFIVPCYKLAHLLADCVDSILAQTYEHFEVLIMDDCSPDDTAAVARSFGDPRVRHIRNEPNLGHLRNYNKGISLASGQFVWLISADDKLRRPHVLERFVAALDNQPSASFVFCPSMKFDSTGELHVSGAHGKTERLFSRPEFLRTILNGNSVSAPAAMARKEYYDRIGGFPLDLPFAGDWYIWARFALDGSVVYLPEAMVSYRLHEQNMTKTFLSSNVGGLVRDEVEIAWRIKADAEARGDGPATRMALEAVARDYSGRVAQWIRDESPYGMTLEEFESSMCGHQPSRVEAERIRAAVYASAGDHRYDRGQFADARACYRRALRASGTVKTIAKYGLARLGGAGVFLRTVLSSTNRAFRETRRLPLNH